MHFKSLTVPSTSGRAKGCLEERKRVGERKGERKREGERKGGREGGRKGEREGKREGERKGRRKKERVGESEIGERQILDLSLMTKTTSKQYLREVSNVSILASAGGEGRHILRTGVGPEQVGALQGLAAGRGVL